MDEGAIPGRRPPRERGRFNKKQKNKGRGRRRPNSGNRPDKHGRFPLAKPHLLAVVDGHLGGDPGSVEYIDDPDYDVNYDIAHVDEHDHGVGVEVDPHE